jgi:4-diphosphocytidyl-2-C-methyl-D-erythritol kinase
MLQRLSLPAPAKLNLMLHIIGRREDGYHLLETVFQFIDLCDLLEFELRDDGRIERHSGNSPIAAADDILLRSASLLQSRYQVKKGVDIAIDKKIPVGGGLGGGSSDAATCLLALNRLWQLDLSLDQPGSNWSRNRRGRARFRGRQGGLGDRRGRRIAADRARAAVLPRHRPENRDFDG